MKRLLLLTLIAFIMAALVLVASVFYEPRPDNAFGMMELHNTARSARPLIVALKRYKYDHGAYPATLALLYPTYLNAPAPHDFWDGWYYETNAEAMPGAIPQGYSLSHDAGRDPVLRYDHLKAKARWYYDPGTGEDETSLPF